MRITLSGYLLGLPKSLRGSITYDNGTEFAQHHLINKITARKATSATPTALGRKVVLKMQSVACEDSCPAKPKYPTCPRVKSKPS